MDLAILLSNTPTTEVYVWLLSVSALIFVLPSKCLIPFPDTGADKKKLCLELGAEKWIDFKETQDITKAVLDATDGKGAHAAVVAAATVKKFSVSYLGCVLKLAQSEAYASAIDYLRPGGTLMVVGLPGHAKLEASIFFTVLKGISILGSYVGYALRPLLFFIFLTCHQKSTRCDRSIGYCRSRKGQGQVRPKASFRTQIVSLHSLQ